MKTGAEKFIVEFHGNFIPLQGVPYIIEAARLVQEQDGSVEFVIIGKGQTYARAKEAAAQAGVRNCNFLGRVPFADIPGYISQADICLGIFGDTGKTQRVIPNKVYEALAMQKPVITADTPAARELLTHKETAWLTPVANAAALAEGIMALRRDSTLRAAVGKSGYECYQQYARPKNLGKRLLRVLEKQERIAVYTAVFGDKDDVREPLVRPDNCSFICFTDNSAIQAPGWEVRVVPAEFADPVRNARYYKINTHMHLPQYDYSVWVDGNLQVRSDVNELVDHYLASSNMAVYDHGKNKDDPRVCVYDEADALIAMAAGGKRKDDPEIMRAQVERYREEGYPKRNGLVVSMALMRRHNEPDVMRAMGSWWNELRKGSRRDQLSFNYVAWKEQLRFVYLPGDSRNNKYFLHFPHKR